MYGVFGVSFTPGLPPLLHNSADANGETNFTTEGNSAYDRLKPWVDNPSMGHADYGLVQEILQDILDDPDQEFLHEAIEEALDDMSMFNIDLQDYMSLGGMMDAKDLPPHMLSGWEN